jgi:hypothetical protein
MHRRVAVPALFAAAAGGAAYALSRLRPRGAAGGRRRRPRGASAEHHEYRCECGQLFHVSGTGRHRIHWLPDASPRDPVLSDSCPSCGRPVPRDRQEAAAPAG